MLSWILLYMNSLDIALIHHNFMAELLDLLSLRQYFIFHKMSAWFCYALICSGLIIRVFFWIHVIMYPYITMWSHEGHGISYHQKVDCLFNCFFWLTSKKISEPVLLTLCEGNPPVTSGTPSQRASNMVTFSMSWRHHDLWELRQGSHMLIHMITPQPAKKSWRKRVKLLMTKPK